MAAIDELARIVASGFPEVNDREKLSTQSKDSLEAIFGERYQARSHHAVRVVFMLGNDNISFAGLVHPDSPNSGAYGGMSLIWFPVPGDAERPASSLLTFVCGTRGLSPDEHILGRPGHARHLQALRRYLSEKLGVYTWTKHDPTNLSQALPDIVRQRYPHFASVFSRYGNYIYCAAEVPQDAALARKVVASFFDFYAWERGWGPLKAAHGETDEFKNLLRSQLFPRLERKHLVALLRERRFVILEGHPGQARRDSLARFCKRISGRPG